jgi:hypothetical protein
VLAIDDRHCLCVSNELSTNVRGAMIEVIKEGLVRRHSPSGWPFFPAFMQREKPTAVRPAWAHLSLELHSASSG